MRMEAAQVVSRAGLVPSGPVRMWVRGQWSEMLLLGFEIHEEAKGGHSRQVERWAIQAMEALHEGEGSRAEQLLKRALEEEPDAPDLQNNLASAYLLQDRYEESEALIREIHQRHPDYFFGRTNMAIQYVTQGKLDQAQALIQPLLSQRRLHRTEFAALCMAQIELLIAEGQQEAAGSWLKMWEGIDPDHPAIPEARRRIKPGLWERLGGWRS
jgi:predicted Zn-dependent protease